jgi:dTDP-4-dehydrorhamnose reductase
MRIALIGARGQLGTDLLPLLGAEAVPLGHQDIEITNPASVAAVLGEIRPQCVINVAAWNLVDKAEDEPEQAFAVNAFGPRNLAGYCGDNGITLLHVSTDYVFGLDATRNTPWTETDAPGPVSAYGMSKLTGEYFVRSLCPRHFVVRTCGLYGHQGARGKGNFVETMLRLGRERPELKIVNDQRCTPSSTADVARALAALIQTDAYGLYHATNRGSMTWYEFAGEIFRQADISVNTIPIDSATFAARAKRPSYSVLDCSKLSNAIGFELPPWQEALACYLAGRA